MTVLLKLGVYTIFVAYTFIAVGFFIFGFGNLICWITGLFVLLFALLTFLYLHGLNTENNWAMLPFLVSELIVRLLTGTFLILCWIGYLLSKFDQIRWNSPIDLLEMDQFLLFLSIFMTLFFALQIRIYFPLYEEYRSIKKLNDRRRVEQKNNEYEEDYVNLHFSFRPTEL